MSMKTNRAWISYLIIFFIYVTYFISCEPWDTYAYIKWEEELFRGSVLIGVGAIIEYLREIYLRLK